MAQIDVPRLFALWADATLSRDEIARLLGVGGTTLQKLAHRYALPPRKVANSRRQSRGDPTLEEIAIRARECRERHYAEKRVEAYTPPEA